MIFTLRIERERIILETTHLNTMREKENERENGQQERKAFQWRPNLGKDLWRELEREYVQVK